MFYIASLVIFAFLFTIWSKNGWTNMLIKFVLCGMTGWSTFEMLNYFGYIVNV